MCASVQDEVDYEAKYHVVKKKYQELRNLRIDSVAADAEELRKKIDEHRRVHEIAVNELRTQNNELKKLKRDYDSSHHEFDRLADSNAGLRRQIQMKDSILSVFLKRLQGDHEDMFKIRVIGYKSYEISHGELVFTLSPSIDQSGRITYESRRYPPSLARYSETEFVNQSISFKATEIAGFCDILCRGISACHL